jgi:peptide/nickel transport system substrate-binding protein
MRWRLIGVLTAVVLVSSACNQSTVTPSLSTSALTTPVSAGTGAGPAATPEAISLVGTTYKADPAKVKGGKVTLAEWQFPDTVNPYYAVWKTDLEASDSMFDGLLSVTPDLKYVPDLATNVPTLENGGVVLNGNGMDVTWNLRHLMVWSDGQPINCDDIKATWQWVMNKDNSGLALGTVGWQDVTGVDGGAGTDCVMHFGKIYEGYLTLVSPLLPAHYITAIPVKGAQARLYPMSNLASGVYSGPYIPVSVTRPASITLKPNPFWSTIGGHAPWLSLVTWKYYGSANTMIDGFQAGEFDLGQNLDNTYVPALKAVAAARQVAHDSLTYEQLTFNNANFKTKFGVDASSVVQAVMLATDRQAIARLPLVGNASPTNNFVSPQAWYYEALGGSKGAGGSTSADPTTAYTILANAGWTKGSDGYMTKNGKTLELNYCTTAHLYRFDALNLIAGQLKQVGIKVDVNFKLESTFWAPWSAPQSTGLCNIRHGNFDVAEFSYVSSFDPLGAYRIYHSSQIPSALMPDGENVSRINLPALDAAYDQVARNVDLSKIRAAMFEIQDLYGSDQNTYQMPLYLRRDIWLVGSKLHNFTGNPTPAGGEWNIGDWWVG